MPGLVCLLLGAFLWFGGDQLSMWLFPAIPASIGRILLLAASLLVAALLFAPTRFLAQAVVMGILTSVLGICRVALQGFLAMTRLIWTSGRTALDRFWGDFR